MFTRIFSKFFGKSTLDIGQVFQSVAKGIDNLGLTEQERAEKMAEFVKNTLDENSARSRARRTIAIYIVANVIVMMWVCAVLYYFGIDIKPIIDLASGFYIPTAFVMVLAFYFGGYYLPKFTRKKEQKK